MTNFNEDLKKYDPEFSELFDNFAFNEVYNSINLKDKTKYIAILAALLGVGAVEEYKVILDIALEKAITPIEGKEVLYQGTAYLGIGKIYPFLKVTNEVMLKKGISLPLEPQGTINKENRREKGTEKQMELFGDNMKDFWKKSNINYWLASNCFGDYYTRTGLDNKEREMITFCYIAATGGCEAQLTAHTRANFNCGNNKDFMLKVVATILPFIGYPRSLNAISIINKVSEEGENNE